VLRAAMLLAGAIGAGLMSVWAWMLNRVDGRFVLMDQKVEVAVLPKALVLGAVAAFCIGAAGVVWALRSDSRLRATLTWLWRQARAHPLLAALLMLAMALGAADFYELFIDAEARRWNRQAGVGRRVYMLREDVKAWLVLAATLMTALAVSALAPGAGLAARWDSLRCSLLRRKRRWLAAAAVVPVAMGGFMSKVALDGVPHFSDALTYQMQGRMLYHGQLSMPAPRHPELFIHSLFFVTDRQHKTAQGDFIYEGDRFFGKYPIGWPAILGLFDALRIGFLANAALAGLGALLTFALARQLATKRVAVLAAVLYAMSPWVWFNGANFASHVASMAAVNGFLWLFLVSVRRVREAVSQLGGAPAAADAPPCRVVAPAHWTGLGAGLCLGAAVLIRPFDAAMFALPAVAWSLWLLVKQTKRWLPVGVMIAIGALVGVGAYAYVNHATTGSATVSPYKLEGRWQADWDASPVSIAGRLMFQWAELNGRAPGFGVGAMTTAVLGLILVLRHGGLKSPCRGQGAALVLAANGLFLGTAALFLFTNVWWGPRWLMPVTPMLAWLGAVVVDSALNRKRCPAAAGQMGLSILVGGFLVGLLAVYGGMFYQHRVAPPHNVSAGAWQRVQAMRLDNAVVGVTLEGGGRAPIDPRAGMVFMHVPFEANPVLFVRQIPDWRRKAAETFPGRELYELIADKEAEDGFVIRPVKE
jgi:hypothetical protein